MIQAIKILITALGMAMLGGCTSTSRERSEAPAGAERAAAQSSAEPGPAGGMMSGMCPMQVPGTTVTAEDIEGGVALVFTTSKGDVAELRRRVGSIAEMHNQHHAAGGAMMGCCGAAHPHEHGAGAAVGGGMMMPAATASVEDIDGGARLVLRPKDPAQLDALRQHVRAHAEQMQHGECPMMGPA